MLESGNPSIFTSDVCILGQLCLLYAAAPALSKRVGTHVPVPLHPPQDHLRLADHQTSPERDRVTPQGHHEAGIQHSGAPRDVYGHGNVC